MTASLIEHYRNLERLDRAVERLTAARDRLARARRKGDQTAIRRARTAITTWQGEYATAAVALELGRRA